MAVPPPTNDLERALLGSILIDGSSAMEACEGRIRAWNFSVSAHAAIFEAMHGLWRKGAQISVIALTHTLRDAGKLDKVGGAAYLTELVVLLPTAAFLEYYIAALEEK